jgi:hypothetical protein
MLDVSESTFRAIYPVLAAKYSLRVHGLGGPKFGRANLLEVVERLADRGLDVVIDKSAGVVRIGVDVYKIGSTRTGKSGRGRPPQPERSA